MLFLWLSGIFQEEWMFISKSKQAGSGEAPGTTTKLYMKNISGESSLILAQ